MSPGGQLAWEKPVDTALVVRVESGEGPDEPPRGEVAGAWWKVAGIFFLFFNIWGIPLSFGVFQAYYTLGYLESSSPSAISWVGTVQSSLLVFMGPVAGPLYDLGYWRHLVVAGICVGLGCGLLYIPSLSLVANILQKSRAIAMGIITSGIALGGIVFTLIFLELNGRIGFGWTVRVIAFVGLVVFVLAGMLLLEDTPTAAGTARSLFDRAALTDLSFLIFTAAMFFAFAGYLVPLFYIPTFAQVVLGTSEQVGLYILVGAQAASLLGRIAASLPAPYTGTMIPWIFCSTVSGILCFCWIAVDSLNGLIAFSVLYGFFSGALIALPPGLFPKICPDPAKLGSRMGISWTATAVATLVGGPIAGAIIDLQSANLLGVQIWSGTMLLVSVLFLCVLWAFMARKTNTWFV